MTYEASTLKGRGRVGGGGLVLDSQSTTKL